MDIPSLHISGETDEHVPTKYQEELRNCFSDSLLHEPETAASIYFFSKVCCVFEYQTHSTGF